jgi:hypothetical protein
MVRVRPGLLRARQDCKIRQELAKLLMLLYLIVMILVIIYVLYYKIWRITKQSWHASLYLVKLYFLLAGLAARRVPGPDRPGFQSGPVSIFFKPGPAGPGSTGLCRSLVGTLAICTVRIINSINFLVFLTRELGII